MYLKDIRERKMNKLAQLIIKFFIFLVVIIFLTLNMSAMVSCVSANSYTVEIHKMKEKRKTRARLLDFLEKSCKELDQTKMEKKMSAYHKKNCNCYKAYLTEFAIYDRVEQQGGDYKSSPITEARESQGYECLTGRSIEEYYQRRIK